MSIIPSTITRSIGRKVLTTKKNSPHIFFAVGVAGVIGSSVLACRATLKLENALDDIQKDVVTIRENKLIKVDSEQEEHMREMMYVYYKTVKTVGILYGPSIILGTVSIAALAGSHIQLTRRNAALTVTLAAITKAYNEYRLRIQEELGEERELEIHRGIQDEIVQIEGKNQVVKTTNPNGWSPYARPFDENNINWVRNSEMNYIFINCQQNFANNRLKARGHVMLNDVYDALGFDRTPAGAVVGWVTDGDGDGYIDFGLFEARKNSIDFVYDGVPSIVLDFNVDGVVYDKIKE